MQPIEAAKISTEVEKEITFAKAVSNVTELIWGGA